MGAILNRFEFRQKMLNCRQGLFIVFNEKRLPKDVPVISLGPELSKLLIPISNELRSGEAPAILSVIVQEYTSVSLTHIDILFTEYLFLDVARVLLSLCRNRNIYIVWPGLYIDGKLVYASPSHPEYYECDPSRLIDTYIVLE